MPRYKRIGKTFGVNISKSGISSSIKIGRRSLNIGRTTFGKQSETINPMMTCLVIVLVVLTVIFALLSFSGMIISQKEAQAKAQSSTAMAKTQAAKPTATPGVVAYKVTKSTGLYHTTSSKDPYEVLPVGTLLKPANFEDFYTCIDMVDNNTTITLCRVEVIDTGESGWVLRKWLEIYKP